MEIPEFPPGKSLDRLLAPASADDIEALWSAHELADVWEHELSSDVSIEAGYLGPMEAIECARLASAMRPPARTVREILWHPKPHPRVVELLAERAAKATSDADKRLPEPVAQLLSAVCQQILHLGKGGSGACGTWPQDIDWVPRETSLRLAELDRLLVITSDHGDENRGVDQ
jgi:hypothetical protein